MFLFIMNNTVIYSTPTSCLPSGSSLPSDGGDRHADGPCRCGSLEVRHAELLAANLLQDAVS